jgi:hypothetical protein
MWQQATEWRTGGLTYSQICGRLSSPESMKRFQLSEVPSEDTIRREVTRRLATAASAPEHRSHHAVTAIEPSPRDLSHLHLHLHGSTHGTGWPSLSTNTQYWVLLVRLGNLSDKPLSFGDFYLEVTRDIPGDPEVHAFPHIGQDTYGSHGGVPLADRALDKLISLSPDRPVIEGALRFQDNLPFDSDYVRLTLTVKGTGPYRGTEKSWELGRFPSRIC